MGRRKQHCPRKAADDDDEEEEEEDQVQDGNHGRRAADPEASDRRRARNEGTCGRGGGRKTFDKSNLDSGGGGGSEDKCQSDSSRASSAAAATHPHPMPHQDHDGLARIRMLQDAIRARMAPAASHRPPIVGPAAQFLPIPPPNLDAKFFPDPKGFFAGAHAHHPIFHHGAALSALHRMSEMAAAAAAARTAAASEDAFRCVWCRDKFPSLGSLTQHLREANHHLPTTTTTTSAAAPGAEEAEAPPPPKKASPPPPSSAPPPRKLVRGQDVWLGKGLEQTRQILKCMWCGESFKSLADMTVHMQETQHYTKVISQEQLSSWTKAEDSAVAPKSDASRGGSGGVGGGNSRSTRKKALPVRKLLEIERGGVGEDDLEVVTRESAGGGGGSSSSSLQTDNSGNILGSLEKMVELSFVSGGGGGGLGTDGPKRKAPPSGLLQRLGMESDEDAASSSSSSVPAPSQSVLELLLLKAAAAAAASSDGLSAPAAAAAAAAGKESGKGGDEDGGATKSKRERWSSEAKFLKYSELARQLSGK